MNKKDETRRLKKLWREERDPVEKVKGKNCVSFLDDDYYTYRYDYFQVESPEHAHKLNLLTDGALSGYEGPHFGTSSVR